MANSLHISLGQYSDKGRKSLNQDFHGACIPDEPQLSAKGIVVALADGISSSEVSQVASEAAIKGFFEDYYCTSETWSVKQSSQRVLMATNSWLHAQTNQSPYRYDKDRGYVCTFSALVFKARTAYAFHVGDARIYQLHGQTLEQLTQDHRHWLSQDQSLLSRALGVHPNLEIDYRELTLTPGDTFLLVTDGVYEFCDEATMAQTIAQWPEDLDSAAKAIADTAYQRGSDDNLTVQIVRVEQLPERSSHPLNQSLAELPLPPVLEARMQFDGYRILRKLHASHRSHVYLAEDIDTGIPVALKTLATELQTDPIQVERFLTEEWIARRIDSPHVAKPRLADRARQYLYTVTEYIEGQTLSQWLIDNPEPDLETVRDIVEQIARGLRAFHRLEMLHQDLRPDNIMIDRTGTIKIIDFGATRVAGIVEMTPPLVNDPILGTAQYTAPEYFVGEYISPRSDLFSLAVITYQMLTGTLPYGTQVAKARTKAAQHKLHYRSALLSNQSLPVWVDEVLKKALQPNPFKRYEELSEFTFNLRHPDKDALGKTRPPLIERDPVLFWKGLSLLLTVTVIVLLVLLSYP